jgi:ATP phosphoribosyltransferase regulatory subunit
MGPETIDPSPGTRRSQIPRGVQDRFLEEAARRRRAEAVLRDCFARWGYRELIPPTFEFYDNLAVGASPRLQQATYRFFDRHGRTLALRPDFTPQVARIAATKLYDQPMPLRCSYVGSLFRYEEPQAGRQREFTQAGVELMGANTFSADAEIVALSLASLEALGLAGVQINLGQMAFFRALVGDLAGDALPAVRQAIDRKNQQRLGAAVAGAGTALQGAQADLICRLPGLMGQQEVLEEARHLCADLASPQPALAALERLARVYRQLQAYGVADRVTLDLGEVRGMDYYTGITFRGMVPGLGWPVVSGGRYDDLVSQFGRPLPAVGFGLSVGRALLAQPPGELPALVPHLLSHDCDRPDCLGLVRELRRRGCHVEVDLLGLDRDGLARAARQRGIARTLRCTGDAWLLTGTEGERRLTAPALLQEAESWVQPGLDRLF